jgi:nucleotide-binding universal stress UspA family protein
MTDALHANHGDPTRPAALRIRHGVQAGTISRGDPLSDPVQDNVRRCLVLGYDRTESARAAAGWAATELLPDGKLVIVHADRPLHAPSLPIATPHERHRLGNALIDELMLDGPDSLYDIDVEAEISDEDPVTALTDAARRHGARAIVIGHEQHSRLRQALGTVTSELLDISPAPVFVVPLNGEERRTRKTRGRSGSRGVQPRSR